MSFFLTANFDRQSVKSVTEKEVKDIPCHVLTHKKCEQSVVILT